MKSTAAQYIPVYDAQTTSTIQSTIVRRKEFSDVHAKIGEPNPAKRGDLFDHQRFFERLMRVYDSILLIADPGTGKTISFLAVAEKARMSEMFKNAYIFEKGKTVIDDVFDQLVDKVAPRIVYSAGEIAGSTIDQKKVTRKLVEIFYKFQTYAKLERDVKKMTDQQIDARFSDCVLIFDEAHNLVFNGFKSARYIAAERIISIAKRVKIILATATPMINSVQEIFPLMNLILPTKLHFPRHKLTLAEIDALTTTQKKGGDGVTEFERRCRGFISYVRAETIRTRSFFHGEDIPFPSSGKNITFKAFLSRMGDIQAAAYIPLAPQYTIPSTVLSNASVASTADGDIDEDGTGAFYRNSLQSALFVFPDGSYGGMLDGSSSSDLSEGQMMSNFGASKYVKPVGGDDNGERRGEGISYQFDTPKDFKKWKHVGPIARSFKEWMTLDAATSSVTSITDPLLSNLSRLSAKYSTIIDIEVKNIKTAGTSFIYSEAKHGGGAILLGMCFELFGFSRYLPGGSDDDASAAVSCRTPFVKLPSKAVRYALLTTSPETPHSTQKAILDIFRSPENVNGELIKVLIGSRITRDGINIFHATRMHILSPPWTESGVRQATARVLRAVSHVDLFEQNKKEILNDPVRARTIVTDAQLENEARINVILFRHASVVEDKKVISADLLGYTLSAVKEIKVRAVMRLLKKCAIDCKLNYRRNVTIPISLGIIEDGTADCDYAPCKYVCTSGANITRFGGDVDSFDALFSRDLLTVENERAAIFNAGGDQSRVKSTRPEVSAREMLKIKDGVSPIVNYQQRGGGGGGGSAAKYIVFPDEGGAFGTTDMAVGAFTKYTVSNDARTYSDNPIRVIQREHYLASQIASEENVKTELCEMRNALQNKMITRKKLELIKKNPFISSLNLAGTAAYVSAFETVFLSAVVRGDIISRNILDVFFSKEASDVTVTTVSGFKRKGNTEKAEEDVEDRRNVYIHSLVSEEDRVIIGEYSFTARVTTAAAAVACASPSVAPTAAVSNQAPQRHMSSSLLYDTNARILFPDSEWRFVSQKEVSAITNIRMHGAGGGTTSAGGGGTGAGGGTEGGGTGAGGGTEGGGTGAVLYGSFTQNKFRVIDKRVKVNARGRVCTTLDAENIISAIIDTEPNITWKEIVDSQCIPKEEKSTTKIALDKAFKSLSREVINAYADRVLSLGNLKIDDIAKVSQEIKTNIYSLGTIQRKYLCDFLQLILERRNLLNHV